MHERWGFALVLQVGQENDEIPSFSAPAQPFVSPANDRLVTKARLNTSRLMGYTTKPQNLQCLASWTKVGLKVYLTARFLHKHILVLRGLAAVTVRLPCSLPFAVRWARLGLEASSGVCSESLDNGIELILTV